MQDQLIPCALCRTMPALIECGVQVSAFGLGEVIVYLCRQDYDALQERRQRSQMQSNDEAREKDSFEQMCQEVAFRGLWLYGGQWPPRQMLWKKLQETEEQFSKARVLYQQADESTSSGHFARLQVLRLAGWCLYEAICLEAAALQEGVGDTAISGTLTRVTYAFIKNGLTLPEKTITRQQVILAMLALVHYREMYTTDDEKEELIALDLELRVGEEMFSQGDQVSYPVDSGDPSKGRSVAVVEDLEIITRYPLMMKYFLHDAMKSERCVRYGSELVRAYENR